MEQGAENGLRPTKKKRYEFEIVEEGWGEYKDRAKTTVGGAKDNKVGREEINDVRRWEQPETEETLLRDSVEVRKSSTSGGDS